MNGTGGGCPSELPAAALRQQLRERRRAIPPPARRHAAERIAHWIATLPAFANAQHVAAYLAVDGEIDPAPLIERAWSMAKTVYLPILSGHPQKHLEFAPYHADTLLRPNRFGIHEPEVDSAARLPPQRLDLVLTPLVGFDAGGNRLGMGGGFYDRTFAFLRHPAHPRKPRLLGLAYACQQVESLPRQAWDVPLDGVVTETGLLTRDGAHHLD